MKKYLVLTVAVFTLLITLPGCEVIGGIFKAGVWSGVLIVAAILALLIFGLTKVFKKE